MFGKISIDLDARRRLEAAIREAEEELGRGHVAALLYQGWQARIEQGGVSAGNCFGQLAQGVNGRIGGWMG